MRFSRVATLRADLDRVPLPDGPMMEIGRIAHKIAGTAATLGFPDLGRTAAEIDDRITRRITVGQPPDRDLVARIDTMLAMMDDVLAHP